jgi:predicted transcriptional regulator
MRHEREIEALDLHPIIKCLVETRLAWQLSVADIADRMGSTYFTLKRYERGDEFPSGKMLLKWVDVLGFELALRHKKFSASARSSKTVAALSEWASGSPAEPG